MAKQHRIWLNPPHFEGDEGKYIEEVIHSGLLTEEGTIKKFEQELCEYVGVNSAAVLQSGTAALHLALKVLGVGAGDYVICQSMTFVASANPILYEGAIPVFVDSEKETWNMCPELLEEAILELRKQGKHPSAIIFVHAYGTPAKVDEIKAIARNYDIPVIEDAAAAMGSEYKKFKAGRFGDVSIVSFNNNKILTTAGGGAILSNNSTYIEEAKFLATQAKEPTIHYEHTRVGYNYRMDAISAAIGLAQIKNIKKNIEKKRRIFQGYEACFENVDGTTLQLEAGESQSNRWLNCVIFDDLEMKHKLIELFLEHDIEVKPVWKPMHMQPLYFPYIKFENGTSEKLFKNGLCLPSGLQMDDLEWNIISGCINKL